VHTLATLGAAAQPSQIGFGTGLIQKDQFGWI
jgi:hypothetical protein